MILMGREPQEKKAYDGRRIKGNTRGGGWY